MTLHLKLTEGITARLRVAVPVYQVKLAFVTQQRKTCDGRDGGADDLEATERGTVGKEIFFETYPNLWTLLVVFWTYGSDAVDPPQQQQCPGSMSVLAIKASHSDSMNEDHESHEGR